MIIVYKSLYVLILMLISICFYTDVNIPYLSFKNVRLDKYIVWE